MIDFFIGMLLGIVIFLSVISVAIICVSQTNSRKLVGPNGTIYWHLATRLHRKDGPAVELLNGSKFWYRNGKLHREDGPAVEYHDGGREWYLNDHWMTEEEFNLRKKQK